MIELSENEIVKIRCRVCRQETNHDVKAEEIKDVARGINEYPYEEHYCYQILECRGCNTLAFRLSTWDDTVDEPVVRETTYPSVIEDQPIPPEFSGNLPGKVAGIYMECTAAIESGLNLLSAVGLRMIVESLCLNMNVRRGNLETKINRLVREGHLLPPQARCLHDLRFMGNESAHEIERPSKRELDIALDIIETLLKTVYVLPKRTEELAEEKTNRRARQERFRRLFNLETPTGEGGKTSDEEDIATDESHNT